MAVLKKTGDEIRREAVAIGRDPQDVHVFNLQTLVLAATDCEARSKHERTREFADHDAVLSIFSGAMGVNLGALPLDEPLRQGRPPCTT